jgi:N-acetylglucosamine-6-phosphate deacetylase
VTRSVDIHTHGIGGFDTRSNSVDDILRIAEIQGSCGVEGIVLSIYSGPIHVMRQHMEAVSGAMKVQGQGSWGKGHGKAAAKSEPGSSSNKTTEKEVNGKVSDRPGPMLHNPCPDAGAARILGVHLEGPFLNPGQCGALDPAWFVGPRESTLDRLLEGFEHIVKVITVAPEKEGALGVIKKAVEKGIVVSMGHSDATYTEAEAGFRAGARAITHLFNAMRGFHHREPGLAGFGLLNKEVYVEVIADPFHLRIQTLELIFETKRPERILLVSDSVRETKAAGDERIVDASGELQGGSMTIAESARRLIDLGFDESTVIRAGTVNPQQYLKLRP